MSIKKTAAATTAVKAPVVEKSAKQYYAGSVEAPAAQAMLKRINKRTSKNPLPASKLEGQYPNRIARMLADLGLVASEKREKVGLVFFAKA